MQTTEELYKRYRPSEWADVAGQDEAVGMLRGMCEKYIQTKGKGGVPHALLFVGDSGCGKTTLARLLAAKMRCGPADLDERNAADARGIDDIRDILRRVGMAPMTGPCRIWIIDECHMMTTEAQNALLKTLEDTPPHVYFMLCTTNPAKLLKTIITRCTQVKINKLTEEAVRTVVEAIADKAEIDLHKDVLDKLVACADGSGRQALVLLDSIRLLDNIDAQLATIAKGNHTVAGIEIARLLYNTKTQWPAMAKLLKGCDEDPESLRYMVLGYAQAILLNGKQDDRAFRMLDAFGRNFYDSKKAGLTAACYEVVCTK